MPHYAFIKMVRVGGKDDFYAHCVLASNKNQAKSLVLADGMGYTTPAPIEIIEFGDCPDGWENSSDLYEKCCKKADKLRLKAQGDAARPMEQVSMEAVVDERQVAV